MLVADIDLDHLLFFFGHHPYIIIIITLASITATISRSLNFPLPTFAVTIMTSVDFQTGSQALRTGSCFDRQRPSQWQNGNMKETSGEVGESDFPLMIQRDGLMGGC